MTPADSVERCEQHIWASVGVVAHAETVYRIWECERCSVWTAEPFDTADEIPWDETWIADR